jgi:hypothetical protein
LFSLGDLTPFGLVGVVVFLDTLDDDDDVKPNLASVVVRFIG